MDIKKEYERWLMNATADADVAAELKTLDDTKKMCIRDSLCVLLVYLIPAWCVEKPRRRLPRCT